MADLQNLQIASLQKKVTKKPRKKLDNNVFGREKKDNAYKLPSKACPFENEVSNKVFSTLSFVKKIKTLFLFRRNRTRILTRTLRFCLREANHLSSKSEDFAALFGSPQEGKKTFSQLFSPEVGDGSIQ